MKTRLLAVAVALLLGVVGSVLLLRYVHGADARALAGTETVDVLIVTAPIEVGTPAEQVADRVELRRIPAMAAVPDRVTDLADLAGRRSAVALVVGEQLLPTQFDQPAGPADGTVEIPDGFGEFTVLLDSQRALGGDLRPGDTVGVFLSFAPDVSPYTTHLTFPDVLVSAVHTAGESSSTDGTKDSAGSTGTADPADAAATAAAAAAAAVAPSADPGVQLYVTFATRAADAEAIIFAAEYGTIWLSRAPAAPDLTGVRVVGPATVYGPDPTGATR